jgi:hypothetical protein
MIGVINMIDEETYFQLGLMVSEQGIDCLFDTSRIKDAKSWNRYYKFRTAIEQDYREIFGEDPK